ncbi:superinfection exclusion B family protein [Psychromonas antarctica]|uniref:superinfection exclusion B family protein n=1 Tax=Psychromonas antarctica TaxID=67573 RepID=UPI001EE8C0EB|nr:superinfection exclusion B family protein [Psychromonas antarctica]MCG6200216.1 superinfection exclusion B family protein [Psychromonas antarctica]
MMQLIQRVREQQGITLTIAWICLASATLLIVPASLLQRPDTAAWSMTYMPYVWILALLTGSYLITRLVTFIFSYCCGVLAKRQLLASRNKMIRQLDFEEKAVLREFIIQRKNVLSLPMNEPAVSNLLRSGVLVPAFETQEIKGSSRIIKLSIAIDAREQLTHKVLSLPVGKLTEQEAIILKAARPDYARSNYIALRD